MQRNGSVLQHPPAQRRAAHAKWVAAAAEAFVVGLAVTAPDVVAAHSQSIVPFVEAERVQL